jgi:hypothetical protein
VVSVQYATIVPMTDADIARDNLSREAYAAVAARRTQFDQLVWQVPVLSLTAQAFLFSIALSSDGTRTTRIIASLLSLVMTFLSLHLMVKHRQAEVADSQWLEAYEEKFPAPLELRNGRCMVDPGRTIATASIRTLGTLAACPNSLGSASGAGASRHLGWQRSSFCYWPSSCPAGSDPHSSTPGASPAAPGAYLPSTRCDGQVVRHQHGRRDSRHSSISSSPKIIESDLVASSS